MRKSTRFLRRGKNVPHDNHIELVTTQGQVTFSHAIVLSTRSCSKLLRPISALTTVTEQIEALTHQPIYTVYLQYPGHVKLPDAMLGYTNATASGYLTRDV